MTAKFANVRARGYKLATKPRRNPISWSETAPVDFPSKCLRWALTHPQSVRKDRIEDRADVFDAKRLRRAKARMLARANHASQ